MVVTDAWHPQVNGVVRTLGHVARQAGAFGAEVEFLSPDQFRTVPLPGYAEIRLALTGSGGVERHLDRVQPDAIHIATEGPLGHAMRRICLRRGMPFTTSFHTRFPDYLAERLPLPARWTREASWAWLRRFHSPGAAVLAATPTLVSELTTQGFKNVKLWSRGVDAELFNPRAKADLNLPRPIFLTVGRVDEKNLKHSLSLELPGTKLIVVMDPNALRWRKNFRTQCFSGRNATTRWLEFMLRLTSLCFPVAPIPLDLCYSRRWQVAFRLRHSRRQHRAMSSGTQTLVCSMTIFAAHASVLWNAHAMTVAGSRLP